LRAEHNPRFYRIVFRYTLELGACAALIFIAGTACSSRHAATSGSISVVDELGRTVTLNTRPERIISLAPSITETLFALGAGDRIAGVTTYCDHPPEATAKEKVGDTLKPNIEKIVALKADLVIVSTSSQLEQYVRRLEDLNVPVYISNPRNIDQVIESISRIGLLIGSEDQARTLESEMRVRISRIAGRLQGSARPSVFFLLGSEPLITVGKGTFLDDLIRRAGGESISGDVAGDYPQFSLETAVSRKPEVIFIQFDEKELPARLRKTPAGENGRVYHLNDDLVSRPGPRIVDGLEQMAAKIHPEISW